jgi:hypothetical protein
VEVVSPPTQQKSLIKKTTDKTKVGTAVGYTPKMVAFESQQDEARAQATLDLATY